MNAGVDLVKRLGELPVSCVRGGHFNLDPPGSLGGSYTDEPDENDQGTEGEYENQPRSRGHVPPLALPPFFHVEYQIERIAALGRVAYAGGG